MPLTKTHRGRVIGPVPYETTPGGRQHVPLGPCMIERMDAKSIDIIWGPQGQKSATMPLEAVQNAKELGNLVLLD